MIARRIAPLRLIDPAVYMYLAAAALVGFAIDGGIYSVLFNLYMVRMGYGPETIGLVGAAGQLVFALFSLPAGMLGERWGSRHMIIAGMVFMVAGCGLVAVGDLVPPEAQVPWLIVNCMLLYVGLALFFVNGPPFMITAVPASQRSALFGGQVATLALAAFGGSLVGGFLPSLLGGALGVSQDSPAAFRAGLLAAAAVLAPAALILMAARPARVTHEEPAAVGAAGAPAAPTAARAIVSLLLVMALIRLLQVAGIASTSSFFNVYLDTGLDVPTEQIGLITAVGRLVAAPTALITPLLAARFGNRSTVIWSTVGTALVMLPLAFIPHWAAAGAGFIGVAGLSSIRYASSIVYFLEMVPPSRRGTVAGVNEMAAGFTFTAMTFGGGFLVAMLGYRSLFMVGAAVTALSALLFWLAYRTPRGAIAAEPQSS